MFLAFLPGPLFYQEQLFSMEMVACSFQGSEYTLETKRDTYFLENYSFRNKYCERATMKKYCGDNKIIYEILNIHCRSLHSFCHEFTRTFLGKFNFV